MVLRLIRLHIAKAPLTVLAPYYTSPSPNTGEIHYHKENKQMGVKRLNSVQKATNLKKIKSGNK